MEDKYQIEAQALAYDQGAAAMECVRSEVAAIPEVFWPIYKDGALLISTDDVKGQKDAQAAYDTLKVLWRTVNMKMGTIANRVRSNVSAKRINVPTVEQVTAAVTAKQQQQPQADSNGKALHDTVNGVASGLNKALTAEEKKLQKSLAQARYDAQDIEARAKKQDDAIASARTALAASKADQESISAIDTAKLSAEALASHQRRKDEQRVAIKSGEDYLDAASRNVTALRDSATAKHREIAGYQLQLAKLNEEVVKANDWANIPDSAYGLAVGLPAALDTCMAGLPSS